MEAPAGLGGVNYIVETKGREDLDVAHKDRAAILWCENATMRVVLREDPAKGI